MRPGFWRSWANAKLTSKYAFGYKANTNGYYALDYATIYWTCANTSQQCMRLNKMGKCVYCMY